MSNRFKFRVWDIKNKKFLLESQFAILGNGKLIVTPSGYYNHFNNTNRDDYVIQQYTSLKDKNDKKIYEGDIVRTVKDSMAMVFGACQYTRGEVTWLREAFCICQSHVGGNEISNYVQCDCCAAPLEIIGNIFENPELLK